MLSFSSYLYDSLFGFSSPTLLIEILNLEKHPFFQERLLGIKGQYLLFESGGVNLRKYLGYDIMLEKVT